MGFRLPAAGKRREEGYRLPATGCRLPAREEKRATGCRLPAREEKRATGCRLPATGKRREEKRAARQPLVRREAGSRSPVANVRAVKPFQHF
jgi:hypothetical protein